MGIPGGLVRLSLGARGMLKILCQVESSLWWWRRFRSISHSISADL